MATEPLATHRRKLLRAARVQIDGIATFDIEVVGREPRCRADGVPEPMPVVESMPAVQGPCASTRLNIGKKPAPVPSRRCVRSPSTGLTGNHLNAQAGRPTKSAGSNALAGAYDK